MEYTNYLTTPSGRYCQVKDITNQQYILLVKFIHSRNYKKFFECLQEIVRKSIPFIDQLDIVQRCYLYVAICMYSIRGTITVNNSMIGKQQIPLSIILNNIESSYTPNFVIDYELKQGIVLNFGYPKSFTFQGDVPVIDYFSGLKGYNGVILNNSQVQLLKSKISAKQLTFIDDFLREKTTSICNIFEGCVPPNRFEMNIFNQSLITNVMSFYQAELQGMYHVMYAMVKHLKMSYGDYLKISPAQTTILLKICMEENKKINEQSKNGGGINMNAIRQMTDE